MYSPTCVLHYDLRTLMAVNHTMKFEQRQTEYRYDIQLQTQLKICRDSKKYPM